MASLLFPDQRRSENVEDRRSIPNVDVWSLVQRMAGNNLPVPVKGPDRITDYFSLLPRGYTQKDLSPLVIREQSREQTPPMNPSAPNPMGQALGIDDLVASGKRLPVTKQEADFYAAEKAEVIRRKQDEELQSVMTQMGMAPDSFHTGDPDANADLPIFRKKVPKQTFPPPSGDLADYFYGSGEE